MRVHFDGRRWRSRLVAGVMLLTLAILAGVAVFAYLAYQQTAADLVIERDRQAVHLAAARLQDEMTKFAEELLALARTKEIYGNDADEQRAELNSARNRLVIFDGGVVLMDNFGKVVAAEPSQPEILGADWSDRDYFRELLSFRELLNLPRVFFSEVTTIGPEGTPVVAISVPVVGENAEFVGALAGMFQLGEPEVSSFYASIVRLRIAETGKTYVIDGDDRILYDSNYARIGETLTLPGISDLNLQGGATRLRDPDGNDVIAAYAPVPGTNWTLVIEDDWATATRPTQRYARVLLVLMALAMVLPAVGVALLVRQQQADMLERERAEYERHAASLIQQRLLPKHPPMLPGWSLAAHCPSARVATGDIHDFFLLADGSLVVALGHAADEHGLAAAHVLATARAGWRGAARLLLSPAETLAYVNELLCPEMQPDSALTLAYALLDPLSGRLQFAIAGVSALWRCSADEVEELQAEGPPLGISLEARYRQGEVTLDPGDWVFFHSNGQHHVRKLRDETSGVSHYEAVSASADALAIVEALVHDLAEHDGGEKPRHDECTAIVLLRLAP